MLPTGLGAIVALGVAAGTAALPPSVTLMVVRANTNYTKPVLLATKARAVSYTHLDVYKRQVQQQGAC